MLAYLQLCFPRLLRRGFRAYEKNSGCINQVTNMPYCDGADCIDTFIQVIHLQIYMYNGVRQPSQPAVVRGVGSGRKPIRLSSLLVQTLMLLLVDYSSACLLP